MAVIRIETATLRSAAEQRMASLKDLGFTVTLHENSEIVTAVTDDEGQPQAESVKSAKYVLCAHD